MIDETRVRAPQLDAADMTATNRMFDFVAGGLVLAIVSFAVVVYAAYHGWYAQDLSRDWAYAGVGYGFLFYCLGAFIFAYGWQGGDTMKALRLGFFICAATLVAIVGLVVLLKLRAGAAAKGAGAVTASGKTDLDGASLLYTAGSMLLPAREAEPQPKLPRDDGLFQMLCSGCGASFAPAPPAARCPYCGTPALSPGMRA
jgi:hypothetical protein